MIQIYSKGNKNFQQNGDTTLFADHANVHVELNGAWSLELHHPIDEEGRWKYLVEDAVIKAPSFNGDQLFRIYSKEKSDDGVSIQAYPIFFDAKNDCFLVDVRPTNKNGQDALNIMCAANNKYSAESNISRSNTSYFEYMNLLEAIGGDSENSFLKRWGGEVLYDNFRIIVNEQVGGDYGVEIRYGKNIPANGVREEVDMSEVVTRIYPKAFNGRKLTSGFVDSPIIENYETVRATTMKFENIKLREDVEGDGTEENVIICDTQAELDAELTKKCKEQFGLGLDKPKVTIDADMVLLQNTEEYKDYKILENVSLGDTIHCKHNKLGIITDARVISFEYDCLLDRVTSVKLGDFKNDYFNNVTDNVHRIESVINPSGNVMADKVAGILDAMKTQLRYQKDVAKKQDVRAILFEDLDTQSPTYGAMCLGTQGFQISNRRTADGRDWDWTTAFTAKGGYADAIVAGTISDKHGRNYWNLETGDFRLTSGAHVGDMTLEDYVGSASDNSINNFVNAIYNPKITELQKQIDGQIETYYYDYQPTMTNVPASGWKTEEDRKKHEGDLFYWKSKGYAYRFFKDGSTWAWQLVQDTDITNALAQAAKAQDTADSKRRTFVTTPVPPYDIGDLWVQGENGDIMRCEVARQSGNYVASDWVKASKYTDNSALTDFINGTFKDTVKDLESQNDKKAETWYQASDPSANWTTADLKNEHIGDMWYNTNEKKSYRWNGTKWEDMMTPVPDEVYDKIDGKAQVFISTPVPPYNVGDLWFDGIDSDILTCVYAKESGSFSINDWDKKNKYTDDSKVDNLDNELNQEGVFNRLTNNGEIQGIFLRDGKLYINATYLSAGIISDKTGKSKWNLDTGELKITGNATITGGTFNVSTSNKDASIIRIKGKQGTTDYWSEITAADIENRSSLDKSFAWISAAKGIVEGKYSGMINDPGSYTAKTSIIGGYIDCVKVTQNSDRNLKKDIEDIGKEFSENLIYNSNPVTFKFKDDEKGDTHLGFIAQDFEEYNGYSLYREEREREGIKMSKGLSYIDFIAPLVKVVQGLHKEIEELKKRIGR